MYFVGFLRSFLDSLEILGDSFEILRISKGFFGILFKFEDPE